MLIGLGLAASTNLLAKSGLFNDITGLNANQANAIQTYLSNNENVRALAASSSALAQQAHNTSNSSKITNAIKTGQDTGLLSKDDAGSLLKKHIQQQIDGGASNKADQEKENTKGKPSLTDAMAKAVTSGQNVKAVVTHPTEGTQSIEVQGNNSVEGGTSQSTKLTNIPGKFTAIQQPNTMACWATAAQMMLMWHENKTFSIQDGLRWAGDEWVPVLMNNTGLSAGDKKRFVEMMEVTAEDLVSHANGPMYFVDLMNQYGPLWVTVDKVVPGDTRLATHAKVVIGATGTGSVDGVGTDFTFLNPWTGNTETQSFADFIQSFEQEVRERPPNVDLTQKVIRFIDPIPFSTQNVSQITSPWDTSTPAHQYMTFSALTLSLIPDSDPSNEFLRGVIWNDDPAVVLFEDSPTDNVAFSHDLRWLQKIKQPSSPKNLTSRSHFGDLQCLHAMASSVGEPASTTVRNITRWFETMYKVSIGASGFELSRPLLSTPLASLFNNQSRPTETQTIAYLLQGCSSTAFPHTDLKRRALGVCLHIIQDAYNPRHLERHLLNPQDKLAIGKFKPGTWGKYGPISAFFAASSATPDPTSHDAFDGEKDINKNSDFSNLDTFDGLSGGRDAVDKCIKFMDFWNNGTNWENGVANLVSGQICALSTNVRVAEAAQF